MCVGHIGRLKTDTSKYLECICVSIRVRVAAFIILKRKITILVRMRWF